MPEGDVDSEDTLAAGDFSAWLSEMDGAIGSDRSADVPCGGCTACCTSAQFVHIAPDETDTLSHISPDLLFPAPRLPRGHVVLGYDERGHCPMLVEGQCSIYQHRPRTCRTYDCRVFAATGVVDEVKVSIGRQAQRWRFRFPADASEVEHQAVRAASAFLDGHPEVFPNTGGPMNPTQLAVLAIEIRDLFLEHDGETNRKRIVSPAPSAVGEEVARRIGGRKAP